MLPFALPVYATADVATRVAIVEGYATNVQFTLSPNPPASRPGLFTGMELALQGKFRPSLSVSHVAEVGARGRYYVPLADYTPGSDGAVFARWAGTWLLSPRTSLSLAAASTIATAATLQTQSASLGSAGGTAALVPTPGANRIGATQALATSYIGSASAGVSHEFDRQWSTYVGIGVLIGATLRDPTPIILPDNSRSFHRGLDGISPYIAFTVQNEIDKRNTASVLLRYDHSYTPGQLDLSSNPPRSLGSATIQSATLAPGFAHRFDNDVVSATRAGVSVVTAPLRDVDQRPVISPYFQEILSYGRNGWGFTASAGYAYSGTYARIGAGPAASFGLSVIRSQSVHGFWKKWNFSFAADASRAAIIGGPTTRTLLTSASATAELRYALWRWVGLVLGGTSRHSLVQGTGAFPALNQETVYLGVSGFWSTDIRDPPLMMFDSGPRGQ